MVYLLVPLAVIAVLILANGWIARARGGAGASTIRDAAGMHYLTWIANGRGRRDGYDVRRWEQDGGGDPGYPRRRR